MDYASFDRLARAFGVSRRGALKTIASGVVAGVVAIAGRGDVAARPKPPKKGDPFYRALKSCRNGEACGSMAPCDPTFRVCMPSACRIEGKIVRLGASNPDNFCQFCNATAWSRWSNRHRDESCPDTTGDPCIVDVGTCSNGECVLERMPDGAWCGDGQICCAGVCCEVGLSCGPGGVCQPFASESGDGDDDEDGGDDDTAEEEVPPDDEDNDDDPTDPDPGEGCEGPDCVATCRIGEDDVADGTRNQLAECEVCDPARNANGWSFVEDNTPCGGVPDRYCCQGICCVPGKCCNQVGLCGSRADGACPDVPIGGG